MPGWPVFLGRERIAVAGGFVVLLLAMFFVRNHYYIPGKGLIRTGPFAISGDEPHYLMVVNSILFDGDLNVRQDYARVRNGGLEAGKRFRGINLDHHAFIIDEPTGRMGAWSHLHDMTAPLPCPEWDLDCAGYRLSPIGFPLTPVMREASSHSLVFPSLLAASVALRAPDKSQVEEFVSDSIVVMSWLGILLTYLMGRRLGWGRLGAFFGAALLIASPWIAYSRSYFAEIGIGFMLIVGLFAMQREKPVIAGLVVAVASGMKPNFVLFGLAWAFERAWARRYRDAAVLAALSVGGVVAMLLFNHWYAWTWLVPPAQLNMMQETLSHGFWVTLLGPQYGVLRFAPWAAVAVLALRWLKTDPGIPGVSTTLVRQIMLSVVPYACLIATMAPGYGASCYGPRYYVCVMPFLALATGMVAAAGSRLVRAVVVATAVVGALAVAVPGWLQYGMLWDQPALSAWDTFSPPKGR